MKRVDIPIDIPGMAKMISSVPEGSLVLLRGDFDSVKSFFAQYLGAKSREAGNRVVIVSSRGQEEARAEMRALFGKEATADYSDERQWMKWLNALRENVTIIIDSFSLMMFDKDAITLRSVMEELRAAVKSRKATAVLVVDDSMLDELQESIVMHSMDGVLSFHLKENPDGVARYFRIMRWTDGRAYDSNIFYTFNERRMNIDLRNRVV